MTAEVKLRTLAQQDDTLSALFGTPDGIFRWFDTQLQPGYLKLNFSCVRYMRVSTVRQYAHGTQTATGLSRQSLIRFQIDVLDFDAERARLAASEICNWLTRSDFSSDAQFSSPVTSPTRHPNVVLNERKGMEYSTQPPAHVQILDVRIFNLEE